MDTNSTETAGMRSEREWKERMRRKMRVGVCKSKFEALVKEGADEEEWDDAWEMVHSLDVFNPIDNPID